LKRSDIIGVNVPRMKMVTVESVHKLAMQHEVISQYLPDTDDLAAEWMPREFLFTIVHSLELSERLSKMRIKIKFLKASNTTKSRDKRDDLILSFLTIKIVMNTITRLPTQNRPIWSGRAAGREGVRQSNLLTETKVSFSMGAFLSI
jgi:hypothetical protein